MISRSNPPTSRFLQLMVGLSLALPGMAQADINVWYQMISSSGPFGDGIAAVQQGVSGAPLVITTDTVAGGYDFTIRMFANMPAAEAIRAYGVDILAPNDASVSVTSLSYLGPFDQNNAIQIGSGPGAIANDAGQSNMTGSPGQAGLTMMFDCVVHLSEPPTADLELFSGIGASTWLPSSLFPLNIVFADAAPLAGATAGGVSSTPSIVFVPDPTGGGGLDCNNNGIPDDQEIAGDPSIDCNLNTIPDDCDIADQTSNDCQGDGIPDECQLDSGGGGLFSEDFDDINTLQSAGWVALNNSQPVGMTAWDQGNDSNFPPHLGGPGAYISANFENAGEPPPATISNWLMTPQLLLVDGRVLTFFTRTIAGSGFPDRLEVRMSLAGFSADVGATATSVGDFTTMLLSINPSLIVGGYPEAWTQFQVVLSGIGTPTEGRLAFRYFVDNSGPQGDNGNIIGIDTIRLTGILDNDLNGNGIPDECEADCNGNSITDFQDIADGTSLDCNTNGIPDECDITDGTSLDCNSNTIPDECDITDGTSLDDNANGIPDECEVLDCNGNGTPDDQDIADGTSLDCNTNGIPDECDITDGTSLDCNTNNVPDECETDCDGNGIPDDCDITADPTIDLNGNGIPDACEIVDCNGNSIPDLQEILDGTTPDCNGNGVPDDCDIDPTDPDGDGQISPDCNANSVPDSCDITDGISLDCNTNGFPDDCETDCDGNGIPDECDIAADPTIDMDGNGIPDVCESGADCNGNGTPDDQDSSDGTSQDCNTNG
ncbi:MAG: choice-of-anchor J domain-containing protein, partial [Phycisphaerae bacterium]